MTTYGPLPVTPVTPEDFAPVEQAMGVTLDKITDTGHVAPTCTHGTPITAPQGCTTCEREDESTPRPRLPQYPLHGHREGLRANDLVTLHSAFVILAHVGGTAHQAEATQCHGIRVAWGVEWCGSCSRRGVWHD